MWLEGFVEVQTGFDAEHCPVPVPAGFAWCMVYAGGSSAAHAWSPAELAAVAHLPRLPVWVPTPGSETPLAAAAGFREWLAAHGVPTPVHVMWDMEAGRQAGDDPHWLNQAADDLAQHGALNLVYGATGTLFDVTRPMPRRDGYVVADPTGVPHLYPRAGVRATQFAFDVRERGGLIDETAMERDLVRGLWQPQS